MRELASVSETEGEKNEGSGLRPKAEGLGMREGCLTATGFSGQGSVALRRQGSAISHQGSVKSALCELYSTLLAHYCWLERSDTADGSTLKMSPRKISTA